MSSDDESFCKTLTCPSGCACFAYAVFCSNAEVPLGLPSNNAKILYFQNVVISKHFQIKHIAYLMHMKCFRCIFYMNILQAKYLANSTYLHMIELHQCNISYIQRDSFRGMLFLKTLSLSGNNLHMINEFTFTAMPSMSVLNLTHLHITTIKPCAFCFLENLKTLNVSHNLLTKVGTEMFNGLPSLHILDLSSNNLDQLGIFHINVLTIYFDLSLYCCYVYPRDQCTHKDMSTNSKEQHCPIILMDTRLQITCLLVSVTTISLCCILMRHHWRTIKAEARVYLMCSLCFVSTLAPFYCIAILTVSNAKKYDYIYVAQHWSISLLCAAFSALFLMSYFMTRFIMLIISINTLIITKFVLIRRPFSKRGSIVLIFVGILICLVFVILKRAYIYNTDITCLPINFMGNNYIFTSIYMGITLLIVLLIIVINVYISKYVAQCEIRAQSHTSSRRVIRQQMVVTTITECTSWILNCTIASFDIWFPNSNNDTRFMFITFVMSVNSNLHVINHIAGACIRKTGRKVNDTTK